MKISKITGYLGILITLLSVIYFYFKPSFYLTTNLDFWLAILTAPFIIKITHNAPSWRLLPIVILVIGTLIFLKSNALYYFAYVFAVFFIIESTKGKLNPLTFFLIFISSAFFRVITNLWSFPIRLQLSEWAGKTLQSLGIDAQVAGNVIYLNGDRFSVDPACMGLSMTITALIIALLMLAFIERQQQRYWKFGVVILLMSLTVLLSIGANFTRLLILILFRIMPENPLHDIMGLMSLAVYVLIPFYFLSRWLSVHFPKLMQSSVQTADLEQKIITPKPHFIVLFLPLSLALTGIQFLYESSNKFSNFDKIQVPHFQKNITEKGILQLSNDSLLIYIKPPSPVYRSTHDPRICWQGSGYKFSDIQQVTWSNSLIYTAQLSTAQDTLYTAWWFDNGKQQTISEWEWRWKSLGAEQGYYLINVSAEKRSILKEKTKQLLEQPLIKY